MGTLEMGSPKTVAFNTKSWFEMIWGTPMTLETSISLFTIINHYQSLLFTITNHEIPWESYYVSLSLLAQAHSNGFNGANLPSLSPPTGGFSMQNQNVRFGLDEAEPWVLKGTMGMGQKVEVPYVYI